MKKFINRESLAMCCLGFGFFVFTTLKIFSAACSADGKNLAELDLVGSALHFFDAMSHSIQFTLLRS